MCNKIVALAKDDAVWPEGSEEPIGRLINIGTSLYMSHGLKRLKRDLMNILEKVVIIIVTISNTP